MSKADKPLNPRQQAFVDAYHNAKTGEEAAIEAGYSEKSASATASKLIRQPNVAAAIDEARSVVSRTARLREADVLNALWHNHEEAVKDGDWNASTRALQLVGKHFGMFTDRVHHSGQVGIAVLVNGIDVADLQ